MNIDTSQLNMLARSVIINPKINKDCVDACAYVMLELIKNRIPNKTGEYFQSWRILKKTATSATVGTRDRQLYVFLEFGTKPHKIEARNKKSLLYGGTNFYVSVQHKGSRRFPHLIPAITEFKQKIPEILRAKMGLNCKVFSNIVKNKFPEKKYTSKNTRGGSSNTSRQGTAQGQRR